MPRAPRGAFDDTKGSRKERNMLSAPTEEACDKAENYGRVAAALTPWVALGTAGAAAACVQGPGAAVTAAGSGWQRGQRHAEMVGDTVQGFVKYANGVHKVHCKVCNCSFETTKKKGEDGYSLCMKHRDVPPGQEWISECKKCGTGPFTTSKKRGDTNYGVCGDCRSNSKISQKISTRDSTISRRATEESFDFDYDYGSTISRRNSTISTISRRDTDTGEILECMKCGEGPFTSSKKRGDADYGICFHCRSGKKELPECEICGQGFTTFKKRGDVDYGICVDCRSGETQILECQICGEGPFTTSKKKGHRHYGICADCR